MNEEARVLVMVIFGSLLGSLLMSATYAIALNWMNKHHIDFYDKIRYVVITLLFCITITLSVGLPLIFVVNEALKGIS